MALLSALVCEKYIDRILGLLMPRYKSVLLGDQANVTFSIKIKILEALDVIPRHITRAAHLVRSVRNQFAHELDLDALMGLPEKTQKRLKDYYASRVTNATPEDIANLQLVFQTVVEHATGVLLSYATSVDALNKAIREPTFETLLRSDSEAFKEAVFKYVLANPARSGVGTPEIGVVTQ
jgi:hypothetical protein